MSQALEAQNEHLTLTSSNGGFTLLERRSGKIIFANASVRLSRYAKTEAESALAKTPEGEVASTETGLRWKGQADGLHLEVRYELSPGAPTLACSAVLTNTTGKDVALGEVSPLYFDRRLEARTHLLGERVQLFTLGRMMVDSSLLGSRSKGNQRVFAVELGADNPRYDSEYILSARPVEEASRLTPEVTFSFEEISKVSCGFIADLERGLAYARADYRGAVIRAGETLELPTLTIDGTSDASEALAAAADKVAHRYQPSIPDQIPTGWCSWYYYYPHVSEEDILENLKYLAEKRDRFPYEIVQIDDGYQLHWGDWLLPGKKFPHDMAYLAREIKDLGFKPGIWVAPMIMTAQSNLYQQHPDWAVRSFASGEPLSQKGWSPPDENPWVILDGTHPDFLDYIRHIFTVMAHDWGYDYFKLDALSHGAYAGLRQDPTQNGDQALRRVLEVIREAVGPEKYILGCTVPFGSAIGLVNGERVSGDVSTAFLTKDYGNSMERYLPQSIHRSFIHGKWWHNDPDCVLVRRQGTPHDKALSKSGLSLEEARFFVTVVGMTQGIQMVGERMTTLEEERLRLLDAILPLMPAPAQPVDLFSPQPEQLHLATSHGELVALLNWSEETRRVSPPWERLANQSHKQDWLVYELWTNRARGQVATGELAVEIPPHGSRLLYLRARPAHPAFAGFSGHVSCGATLLEQEAWCEDTNELRLTLEANAEGDLHVYCPTGWKCKDPTFDETSEQMMLKKVSKGRHEWRIPFVPRQS